MRSDVRFAALLGVAAVSVAAATGCTSTSSDSDAVSSHINDLYLNSFSNPTPDPVTAAAPSGAAPAPTVSFAYNGNYSVTAGQPFSTVTGCTTSGSNNGSTTCTMTVNAGRSNSTPVAQWFTEQAPSAWCTINCGGSQPSELNFAVAGTLTINGTSYPVAIGQGSFAAGSNNWWIGGPGWGATGCPTSFCTPDGQYGVYGTGDDSMTFIPKQP